MKRAFAVLGMMLAGTLPFATGCGASPEQAIPAQQMTPAQGSEAMAKLHWMAGTWTCSYSMNSKSSPQPSDHPNYRFFGSWMAETSGYKQGGKDQSSVQVWGYDVIQKRLVSHQFTQQGIFTKSVDGWVNGKFVSHRDEDGATVSIVPNGPRAFDWLIVSADNNYTVREACTR